ncbi:23 kDa integral membrane protein-like isoform X2 [Dreissena polymorpha]|uniref:23 kDa integral membrane protein-like isoform X2 n=1 Tax=Dreissena polymorpha TaxID=45954 RepID=UPI0022650540|nr:23 kDa integral membrane protein-like isoform X2 [Dreissena polymorpha]
MDKKVIIALAIWVFLQKNTVKTIQDLLGIYDMETHIGAVAIGILCCGIIVPIVIFVSAILCNFFPEITAWVSTASIILMCVVYLIFGFLSATYDCQFDDRLEITLNKSLKEDYIDGKGMVAKAWDKIQFELSCCGVLGPKDYADVKFITGRYVPVSCCQRQDTHAQPFNETMCQDEADLLQHKQVNNGSFLNTVGCYSEMKTSFHKYLLKMMWLSFGMCITLVICLTVTLCIICIG